MQERLPFELRSMIYTWIWDDPTVEFNLCMMAPALSGQCRSCNTEYFDCGDHIQVAHYIRPILVGQEAAREVMEAWYEIMFRTRKHLFHVRSANQVTRMISVDHFYVGLDLTTLLRSLYINVSIEDYSSPLDEGWLTDPAKWQQLLGKSLCRIKNKARFTLTVKLAQKCIRLHLLPAILEMFRVVLGDFENHGAKVNIFFTYQPDVLKSSGIDWDLKEAMQHPESDWKPAIIAYLEVSSEFYSLLANDTTTNIGHHVGARQDRAPTQNLPRRG
jgi:hypothetical protein